MGLVFTAIMLQPCEEFCSLCQFSSLKVTDVFYFGCQLSQGFYQIGYFDLSVAGKASQYAAVSGRYGAASEALPAYGIEPRAVSRQIHHWPEPLHRSMIQFLAVETGKGRHCCRQSPSPEGSAQWELPEPRRAPEWLYLLVGVPDARYSMSDSTTKRLSSDPGWLRRIREGGFSGWAIQRTFLRDRF